MICESFPPIEAARARALIVGSMPGIRSLQAAEYYAHPQNAFWRILRDVLGGSIDTYEGKTAIIRKNALALWDAACTCEREGSLDSAMRGVQLNDFPALFARQPEIRTVLCNGATAYTLFTKGGFAGNRTIIRMPSTSPAYTMAYEKKREIWKDALFAALSEK